MAVQDYCRKLYRVATGQDAGTVGDEQAVLVDFQAAANNAKA